MLNGHIDPNVLIKFAKNTTKCKIYFTCYCHICARNRYIHQFGNLCHIGQKFNRLIWKMYAHICVSYEVTAINKAGRTTVEIIIAIYVSEEICPPNWTYTHLPNIWWQYMSDVYSYMCHIWDHCHQSCNKEHCIHIWNISMTNMADTVEIKFTQPTCYMHT